MFLNKSTAVDGIFNCWKLNPTRRKCLNKVSPNPTRRKCLEKLLLANPTKEDENAIGDNSR